MPRQRVTEKMTQPSITEYFSVRKSRKRTAENLKGKERLSTSPIAKKILISDTNLDSKHKTRSNSSSSSRLLISVLEKQAKLTTLTTKVTLKENNNPNVKNVLDSSKVDTQETSTNSSEIVVSKEESLKEERLFCQQDSVSVEDNLESSPKEESSSETSETKKNSKKVQQVKLLKQEENTRTEDSIKLVKAEVPVDKISNTTTPTNNNSLEAKDAKKSQLLKPKKSQNTQNTSQSSKIFLPLPNDYKFLMQIFICIDRVAMMLYNRGEIITFSKLQPALRNMSTQNVTIEHLAQIKTIYPEAYTYQQKKLRILASGSNKPQYEIVLSPNFETHSNVSETFVLTPRKKKFYNVLLEKVKDEHEKFLMGLRNSKSMIPKDKITRWHPRFDIEKCKPIEPTDLQTIRSIKITSPKEVLEKVKECFKVNTNLQNPPEAPETPSKPVEKKVDEEAEYYHRLPSIAKLLRNIYLSEKKNVLSFYQVVQKLQYSYSVNLTLDVMEKQVRLLCKLVPDWISLFNLGSTDRLKIQQKIPFEKVSKILEAIAKNK